LLATVAFAWQIYFDFSGYTDMARSIARVMGFRMMLNSNNPYTATDLGDFWSRWHISLSTWFKDYLYFPLGGNRKGEWITYRNLIITFVVSGIWHGANWTFVVWGALHALGRCCTRGLERADWYTQEVPRLLKQTWGFVFVCFSWIFFRARSLQDAWLIIRRIATRDRVDPGFPVMMLLLVLSVWVYQLLFRSGPRCVRFLYYAPATLASDQYGDASHPLAPGYEALARELLSHLPL
jgi:D-alanyl-lipoteichoic acid acyltransferase DltB (MBOAT superfamily)